MVVKKSSRENSREPYNSKTLRTSLQRKINDLYNSNTRQFQDNAEKIDYISTILGNNGRSYEQRTRLIEESVQEVYKTGSLGEKNYVERILGLVEDHLKERRIKQDGHISLKRGVKNRLEAVKNLNNYKRNSFESFAKKERAYREDLSSQSIECKINPITYATRPSRKRAGKSVISSLVGVVIVTGASLLVSTGIGGFYGSKRGVEDSFKKIAPTRLEERVKKETTKEIFNSEKSEETPKRESIETKNLSEKTPLFLGEEPSKALSPYEGNFNNYGEYLGEQGSKQSKEGKRIESAITGIGSWLSLINTSVGRVTRPAIQIIGGVSRTVEKARIIEKGLDVVGIKEPLKKAKEKDNPSENSFSKGFSDSGKVNDFVWRNSPLGPNSMKSYGDILRFGSIGLLDFKNPDDPYVTNDGVAGLAVRVGSHALAAKIIGDAVSSTSSKTKYPTKGVSGGRTSEGPGMGLGRIGGIGAQ